MVEQRNQPIKTKVLWIKKTSPYVEEKFPKNPVFFSWGLPMINHWQEKEENDVEEDANDKDQAVFISGERDSANIG